MKSSHIGNFVDHASRILASPLPRRQAFRTLGYAVTTTLFGAFGIKRAMAVGPCHPACTGGQTCCPGIFGEPFCAPVGATCCGQTYCRSGQICCHLNSGISYCAPAGRVCCGLITCSSGQTCCTTPLFGLTFCITSGHTCCGFTSCGTSQTCCANLTCCGTNQACHNGRCVASQS